MKSKLYFFPFLFIFLFTLLYTTIFHRDDSLTVQADLDTNELLYTPLEHDNKTLHVYYFYLEHHQKSGSSMLIYTPDGYTMLIDAGIQDSSTLLSGYLHHLGIEKIDMALATHPHHDHIGGYLRLLDEVEIKQFFMPNVNYISEIYREWIEKMEENSIPYEYLYANQSFTLGNYVTIHVLNPSEYHLQTLKGSYSISDINNQSLVLKMNYKNHSFLFTGDIYDEQEEKLIDSYGDQLKATVLEAPHHGGGTSSSTHFIRKVSPEYAVMNANILQSLYVLRRYELLGVSVLPTDIYGTVHLQTDGENLKIMTEFNHPPTKKSAKSAELINSI